MSLPMLNTTLHTSNARTTDPDGRDCFYVDIPGHDGLGVMVLHGKVARIDVDDSITPTARGIHNGDTEAHAVEVYGGRLSVSPHAYEPDEGHYLTIHTADGKSGIRFETEDGRITRYYAGAIEAIALIEGCS